MKDLYELKETLCKELEEYAHKGKMSAGDLEVVHKLIATIKDIGKIGMLEEEGGYSQAGGMMGGGYGGNSYARGGGGGGSYARGGSSYDDGMSYRRQRRDSRGRYSREAGYSYADGMEELHEILDEVSETADERTREMIRKFKMELGR